MYGTRYIEWSTHIEIIAMVIQNVHLGWIKEDAAFLIPDECVIRKAVPKSGYNIIELARTLVAFGMFDMLFLAEVER